LAPFIVTLAMMTVARGLTFIYSGGQPISGLPQGFLFIGKGNLELASVLVVPLPALVLAVCFVVGHCLLGNTPFGRHVYAVGGTEYAATVSGIHAGRVKVVVYTLCGFLAGVASIILTARVAVGLPQAGQGYELDAIAAVVIGGTSLAGGRGRLWGTLVGVLILGVLSNGLDLLGVGSFYQQVTKGLIILAAVLMDAGRSK
jgi:ribose/xylose/arabinose/galactoside ABC-type transport system permease subunit